MENRKATEAGQDVTMQKEDFAVLWKTIHLKVTDTYEVPPEILWVNGSTIGTLGNFSASTGKAKSKKTFNISAIVAAALKNDEVLKYSAYLPPNKRKILYVDTEQSKYHCHKVMERILRLAGLPTDKDRDDFVFIVLREQTPDKRKQIIGYMLENMPDVGLLIIDGIRDLMYDINSPSESTDLINLLMRWSSGYNLHIHTVLHLNKGDDNTRGHIGTELNNKAETVLQITKSQQDGNILCLTVDSRQSQACFVRWKNNIWLCQCLTIHAVEFVYDFFTLLQHRQLILSYRYSCCTKRRDICCLTDRIAEKSDRNACLKISLLNLGFYCRVPLYPGHCNQIHIIKCKLCQFRNHRLNENIRFCRVDSASKIIQCHIHNILSYFL